jgi:hypothetical protein
MFRDSLSTESVKLEMYCRLRKRNMDKAIKNDILRFKVTLSACTPFLRMLPYVHRHTQYDKIISIIMKDHDRESIISHGLFKKINRITS